MGNQMLDLATSTDLSFMFKAHKYGPFSLALSPSSSRGNFVHMLNLRHDLTLVFCNTLSIANDIILNVLSLIMVLYKPNV